MWPTLSRALFRWSYAVLLILQHENSDFPSKTTNGWEWDFSLWYHKHSASSCKSCRHIVDTDLTYRRDFLLETITQLIAHWWKMKNIQNKIFNNPLFKIMLSCVRIKILFIEYKYYGLNAIFFIESKYILLNTNIFS